MRKPELKAYVLTSEELQELLLMARKWSQRRKIDNLSVVARAMREVADVLDKVAAKNGYGIAGEYRVDDSKATN